MVAALTSIFAMSQAYRTLPAIVANAIEAEFHLSAEAIGVFAGAGNHSMMVTTKSDATHTAIRLGNTGAQQNLPRLVAACQKALGDRAALVTPRTGGLALAK